MTLDRLSDCRSKSFLGLKKQTRSPNAASPPLEQQKRVARFERRPRKAGGRATRGEKKKSSPTPLAPSGSPERIILFL